MNTARAKMYLRQTLLQETVGGQPSVNGEKLVTDDCHHQELDRWS